MDYFSQYIKSILTIGIFSFMCEFIYTNFSKNSSIEKAAKLITNLCIFFVIFSPIFSLIHGTDLKSLSFNTGSNQEITENTFINLTESELEKVLSIQIFKETGIEAESISIKILCNDGETSIASVSATVKDELDIKTVKEYITSIIPKTNDTEIMVKTNEKT